MINISSSQSWFNTPNNISLKDYTDKLFKNNPILGYRTLKGIITPHAGIIYSGNVSARMYNHLLENINKSKFKKINLVILCTNHYLDSRDLVTTTASSVKFDIDTDNDTDTDIDTDTRIGINTKLTGELYNIGSNIIQDNEAFVQEHSFFNQLPFLTYLQNHLGSKKEIKIVPIIVTTYNISSLMEKKLLEIINKPSSFFIISTDFNHVGPRFGTRLPTTIELRKMDMLAIDFIINKKYMYLEKGLSVCGDKILILLDRLKNIKRGNLEVVIRKTSADSKSSNTPLDSVVSYLGILFIENK